MLTFDQFLIDVSRRGGLVNTLFEKRIFELLGILDRVSAALGDEHIDYELVGGLAVFIHLEEAASEHSATTRDVDLMIRRSDLDRVRQAAAKCGFRFRHAAGVDMLLYGSNEGTRDAVHLLFSGEKVRPDYLAPTPAIAPIRKRIHGAEILVCSVPDLVQMKLTSFRLKDQVHVKALDAAGLITADVERGLMPELCERLRYVRQVE